MVLMNLNLSHIARIPDVLRPHPCERQRTVVVKKVTVIFLAERRR